MYMSPMHRRSRVLCVCRTQGGLLSGSQCPTKTRVALLCWLSVPRIRPIDNRRNEIQVLVIHGPRRCGVLAGPFAIRCCRPLGRQYNGRIERKRICCCFPLSLLIGVIQGRHGIAMSIYWTEVRGASRMLLSIIGKLEDLLINVRLESRNLDVFQ